MLRVNGYRIGFYSSESDEPAHMHVVKAGCEAKFWHGPVQRTWNKGFRKAELRGIDLIEAWNETE